MDIDLYLTVDMLTQEEEDYIDSFFSHFNDDYDGELEDG